MPYADGTFTSFKQNGPVLVTYPFLNSAIRDANIKQYEINGVVLPGSYTPANALSTFPGDAVFALDNIAYLTGDGPPRAMDGHYELTRVYNHIPGDQIEPGSQTFVRPVMDGITISSVFAVSIDNGETSHFFTSRQTCTAVGAINTTTQLRSLNSAAHGAAKGDIVVAWSGSTLVGFTDVVIVPSGTNLAISTAEAPWSNLTLEVSHFALTKDASVRYVNGPRECSARTTQSFYLPTITPGITTYADIPSTPVYNDPLGWMQRIVDANTWSAISVSDISSWKGPILTKSVVEIQMSDALQTRGVTA